MSKRNIIRDYVGSKVFCIAFLLIISLTLYVVVKKSVYEIGYIDKFIAILCDPWFYSGVFIFTVLMVDLNIYKRFENSKELMIRMENCEKYDNFIKNNILLINNIIFIITIIVIIILLNFSFNGFGINTMNDYNIFNYIYLIYQIFKIYMLSLLLSMFNYELLHFIDKRIIVFLNIILVFMNIENIGYNGITINAIKNMPLLYNNYINKFICSNFFLELQCFVIYLLTCLILVWIIDILRKKIRRVNIINEN